MKNLKSIFLEVLSSCENFECRVSLLELKNRDFSDDLRLESQYICIFHLMYSSFRIMKTKHEIMSEKLSNDETLDEEDKKIENEINKYLISTALEEKLKEKLTANLEEKISELTKQELEKLEKEIKSLAEEKKVMPSSKDTFTLTNKLQVNL